MSRSMMLTAAAAIAVVLALAQPVLSAPFPYGKMRSPREKGCYYLLKHYNNGDQIETNEPCLNCSCHNSMLMCYLRVCPYVRPIGDRCIIEKVHGECCPKITCPDVTPEPEVPTTTTTAAPDEGPGCYIDGEHYREGAQIPSDPGKPCEVCYCIRNTSACVVQECTLSVGGCAPLYTPNSCCPTRYNCSNEAATTVPPELRHPSVPEQGCVANGRHYVDGEAVPSANPCEHCYCMKNEVVCAVQECKAPCEGCVPIPSDNDQCCPERYECTAPTRSVPPKNVHLGNSSSFTTSSSAEPASSTTTASTPVMITSSSSQSPLPVTELLIKEVTTAVVSDASHTVAETSSSGSTTISGSSTHSPPPQAITTTTTIASAAAAAAEAGDAESLDDSVEADGISGTTTPAAAKSSESATTTRISVGSEAISGEEKGTTATEPSTVTKVAVGKKDNDEDEHLESAEKIEDTPAASSSPPLPVAESTSAANVITGSSVEIITTASEPSSSEPTSSSASSSSSSSTTAAASTSAEEEFVTTSRPRQPIEDGVSSAAESDTQTRPADESDLVSSSTAETIDRASEQKEQHQQTAAAPKDERAQTTQPAGPSTASTSTSSQPLPTTTIDPEGNEVSNVDDSVTKIAADEELTTQAVPSRKAGDQQPLPPGQPRKEDGIKVLPAAQQTTRRPNTHRKPFPSAGVIPGEGICRYEGRVYQNGDEVSSSDPCAEYCMCLNSVVYCDETICDNSPPPTDQNCTKVHKPNECCPHYECHQPTTTTTTTTTTTEAPPSEVPTTLPSSTSHATEQTSSTEAVKEIVKEESTSHQPSSTASSAPEIQTTVAPVASIEVTRRPASHEPEMEPIIEEVEPAVVGSAESSIKDEPVEPAVTTVRPSSSSSSAPSEEPVSVEVTTSVPEVPEQPSSSGSSSSEASIGSSSEASVPEEPVVVTTVRPVAAPESRPDEEVFHEDTAEVTTVAQPVSHEPSSTTSTSTTSTTTEQPPSSSAEPVSSSSQASSSVEPEIQTTVAPVAEIETEQPVSHEPERVDPVVEGSGEVPAVKDDPVEEPVVTTSLPLSSSTTSQPLPSEEPISNEIGTDAPQEKTPSSSEASHVSSSSESEISEEPVVTTVHSVAAPAESQPDAIEDIVEQTTVARPVLAEEASSAKPVPASSEEPSSTPAAHSSQATEKTSTSTEAITEVITEEVKRSSHAPSSTAAPKPEQDIVEFETTVAPVEAIETTRRPVIEIEPAVPIGSAESSVKDEPVEEPIATTGAPSSSPVSEEVINEITTSVPEHIASSSEATHHVSSSEASVQSSTSSTASPVVSEEPVPTTAPSVAEPQSDISEEVSDEKAVPPTTAASVFEESVTTIRNVPAAPSEPSTSARPIVHVTEKTSTSTEAIEITTEEIKSSSSVHEPSSTSSAPSSSSEPEVQTTVAPVDIIQTTQRPVVHDSAVDQDFEGVEPAVPVEVIEPAEVHPAKEEVASEEPLVTTSFPSSSSPSSSSASPSSSSDEASIAEATTTPVPEQDKSAEEQPAEPVATEVHPGSEVETQAPVQPPAHVPSEEKVHAPPPPEQPVEEEVHSPVAHTELVNEEPTTLPPVPSSSSTSAPPSSSSSIASQDVSDVSEEPTTAAPAVSSSTSSEEPKSSSTEVITSEPIVVKVDDEVSRDQHEDVASDELTTVAVEAKESPKTTVAPGATKAFRESAVSTEPAVPVVVSEVQPVKPVADFTEPPITEKEAFASSEHPVEVGSSSEPPTTEAIERRIDEDEPTSEASSTASSSTVPPTTLGPQSSTVTVAAWLQNVSSTTTLSPTTTTLSAQTTTEQLIKDLLATSTVTSVPSEKPDDNEELEEGTCIFEGKAYQSAEQIPRPHACDFCFCFRGDIICLQQTCPPPIPGCYETPIQGFCCPRYECPVQTGSNVTTPRSVDERRAGCEVNGKFYLVGQTIKPASGPCMECKCDHSGVMSCDPQSCFPQPPLLLRMNREFFSSRKRR